MSNSQRVLVYAGSLALLSAGLGVWAGGMRAARAPAASARADAPKIAVVDVLDVAEKLFLSERYTSSRELALKEKQDQATALQTGLNELEQKIRAAGPDTPEGKLMMPTYQSKAQEFQQFEQAARVQLNEQSTTQFGECYRLAVETAQSIAREQGYTHVLSSKTGPLEFRATEFMAAVQEVLARPVLMSVAGDDLTGAVRKQLKIGDEPAGEKTDKGSDGKAPAER